jgi:hypothetical protein
VTRSPGGNGRLEKKDIANEVIPAISFLFLTPSACCPLVQVYFLEEHQAKCMKCSHFQAGQLDMVQTKKYALL